MRGELGIKIKKIQISKPYTNGKGETSNDLSLYAENGDFIHIVGDNDISELLETALAEYANNNEKEKE